MSIGKIDFSKPINENWIFSNKEWFCFCSQMNWVCDEDWKPALTQSLYFVGSVFGTLGLGIMADHIGRLHVVVIANMISFVGNMATAFAKDFTQLSICRVFAGLANDCNFVMMYIIGIFIFLLFINTNHILNNKF